MNPKVKDNRPALPPPESGVTVRMYNPGFGDCFLLAFRAEDGSPRYMLIDCGVHHQYHDGEDRQDRMKRIAADIAAATGKHLHIVAITHEHTDHLYGFKYAREIFDDIQIDNLWLAWTENSADPVAKQLKKLYGRSVAALNLAIARINPMNRALAARLQGVLDFEMPSFKGEETAELKYLRGKCLHKLQSSDDYRHPGEVLNIPGVKGVKVYVLGPPKDTALIKKLNEKAELYPELAAMDELEAFSMALMDMPEEDTRFAQSRPFARYFEITGEQAAGNHAFSDFFRQYYGFKKDAGHGPEWRRTDADWLAPAEQLALKINSYTNNTSLVIAIEITTAPSYKVLLFAADAQVGNWLSWQELEFPGEGPEGKSITGAELLQRTVFYKVGHHGSHNATLRSKGLEMMSNSGLVAMIPVDEKWAKEAQGWEHPAKNLLDCLEKKTGRRIIRTDEIPPGNKPPVKPDEADADDWRSFINRLDWDRDATEAGQSLWIQYTV